MSKLFKIGIPIMIVLLMLIVVGTGIALAKGQDTAVLTRPAAYDGYSGGTCPGGCLNNGGCWNSGGYCPGPGAGYGPGGCCSGNTGNYPPCHGY